MCPPICKQSADLPAIVIRPAARGDSEYVFARIYFCWSLRLCLTMPRALGYSHRMKSFSLTFFQKTGKVGGSAKSRAKAEAARKNGKKGGRPRKVKQ